MRRKQTSNSPSGQRIPYIDVPDIDLEQLAREALAMGLNNPQALEFKVYNMIKGKCNYIIGRKNSGRERSYNDTIFEEYHLVALLYMLAAGKISLYDQKEEP